MILEFDSDKDGALNIEEFKMLVLPSANDIIRDIANNRKNHYGYDINKPLEQGVLKELANHIEEEIKHLKKRNEIKRQLLQN